jgi:hypothetical protein
LATAQAKVDEMWTATRDRLAAHDRLAEGGGFGARLTLEPRRVLRVLLVTVAALAVLTVLARSAARWVPDSITANGLAVLDAGSAASVPTFFTSLLLLACAVLAAAVARVDVSMTKRWRMLGLVLAALALDETIELHETTSGPLRDLFNAGGVLYFTWVIPGIVFVMALAVLFAALPGRLPETQRRLFVAAVALFFGAAIGLELVEGWLEPYGEYSVALIAMVSIEETLEMVGVVLLLYALMLRLAPWSGTVRLS